MLGLGSILVALGATPAAGGAPAPTVTSVSPTSGPELTANSITVFGANFVDGVGLDVLVNGFSGTNVAFVSSGELTCDTPELAGGPFDVTVVNPDTQTGTLPEAYTFVEEEEVYDLAALALTGFWDEGDYVDDAGGGGDEGLWTGKASAGASGGRNLTATAGGVPVNDGGSPSGDGVDDVLTNALTLADYFDDGSEGTIGVAFEAYEAPVIDLGTELAQAPYNAPGFVSDTVGYMCFAFCADGLVAGIYDGVFRDNGGGANDGWQMVVVPCSADADHYAQMRWTATSLDLRVDGGAWTSLPCGAITNLTGSLIISGYAANALEGKIRHIDLADFAMTDEECDGALEYVAALLAP